MASRHLQAQSTVSKGPTSSSLPQQLSVPSMDPHPRTATPNLSSPHFENSPFSYKLDHKWLKNLGDSRRFTANFPRYSVSRENAMWNCGHMGRQPECCIMDRNFHQ